ncbi:DUF490 domain-containing protein [Bacteroidales bacterium]|nr:DUF490 domain-containing protein [Bacteroidales bacterium]
MPAIQRQISTFASSELQKKLGVETKIERIDFELFNKLILKDVYLADQQGDTLLHAKRLAVGFDFLPLFKGKLNFSSAQLFSFQINLSKATEQSPLNLQFVIDAFASKDTMKKESNINLNIRNLNLRRGNFSFKVKDAPKLSKKFNPKDVVIANISAKINLDQLSSKSLIANVQHLSFQEQSGFTIRRLAFDINATKQEALIQDLEIQLPNSLLHLKEIHANYDSLSDNSDYLNNTQLKMHIIPSDIVLKDIAAIVPAFSNFVDKVNIQGVFSGSLKALHLDNFKLSSGNKLFIEGDLQVNDATDKKLIYIDGEIEESFISKKGLKMLINNFSEENANLPEILDHIGDIKFEGSIEGYFHHLNASGLFHTGVGSLKTNIALGEDEHQRRIIKGKLSSQGLNLNKLFGHEGKDLGNTSFEINVNAHESANNNFAGTIKADIGRFEYKNYGYENLLLNGKFTEKSFEGEFNLDSPEGKISSNGLFVFDGLNSQFNFSAKAYNIKLDRLNLSDKYKDSDLSFEINTNFLGNNIDNLVGNVSLSNLKFNTLKGGYYLDKLNIDASEKVEKKIIRIESDIINGQISGNYTLKNIIASITQTASQFIPAIVPAKNKISITPEQAFNLNLTINDTEGLSYILDLPFALHNKTKIIGQYNSALNKFRLELYMPKFSVKNTQFEGGTILLDRPDKEARLQIEAVSTLKNKQKLFVSSIFSAYDNLITTQLSFDNDDKDKKYSGNLAFNIFFETDKGPFPLQTNIDIQESTLTFNDTIWNIRPSNMTLDSSKFTINNFAIDHGNQYLKIDGSASKIPEDKLHIDLRQVNLEYIFTSLGIKALEFGGYASGSIELADLYHSRQLSTQLEVKDFSFNQGVFGDLSLKGWWDDSQEGIRMIAHIKNEDSTKVDVDGIIFPLKEEMSFKFDAQYISAYFLRKYLGSVAQNVSGLLSGQMHLFGSFSTPDIEGDVYADKASFDIEFLNTRYSFSDSVIIKPGEIMLKNTLLKDKFGQASVVNGYLKHNSFSDFHYRVNLDAENFLVFDAKEYQNPSFFGSAFGTGSAEIKGTEQLVLIDVSMRSNSKTKMRLNFMETEEIAEYDFINFVSKKDESIKTPSTPMFENIPIVMKTTPETEMRFNLNLEATPDAVIEIVMDPLSGDLIKGTGRGNLQIQYGTKLPLKIFGKYTIQDGNYNFSMQQVIHRNFKIKEGSTVSFMGDPYQAIFDVDAYYSLSANPTELHENLSTEGGRSVPVNCVLNITGEMQKPNLKFNIELPNSNSELDRQIKSIINTEEMMNQQVVYLLVLNRFYTLQENRSAGVTPNDFATLASSSVTQLANMLGGLGENFQIGTKFKAGDNSSAYRDTEIELLLSSQLLNNRLIFNGNFGYRDNPYVKSTFIGDFDLEYKLTKSGEIRLKVYNHFNDMYYSLKPSPTTQGIGILYKKDFDKASEVFKRRKRLPPLISLDSYGRVK